MTWIGIDPGGRTTGLVIRDGRTVLHHTLVVREGQMDPYLDDLLNTVHEALVRAPDSYVAVEGLNPPTPHLGMTSVGWLMDTAQVLGAVRTHWDCTVVPPAKHGKVPDIAQPALDAYMAQHYPAELLGPRELGGKYGGKLRHARSAWDVSVTAERRSRTVQQKFGITS